MMSEAYLDTAQFLRRFGETGTRVVLIGGMAAIILGIAYATQDIDFCYDAAPDNRIRLLEALAPLQPRLRVEGLPAAAAWALPWRWDERALRDGPNLTLQTDAGPIDLLSLVAGLGGYAEVLRSPAGLERGLRESLNRAWTYLQSVSERMSLADTLRHRDVVAEAIDLSGGRVECACGVAFFAAILSALNARRVQAGTVVLGDLTIQGNVKALTSITEVLQLALDNGAFRALLPTGNKAQFAGLPENVVDKLNVIFYSDVDRAVARVLEL